LNHPVQLGNVDSNANWFADYMPIRDVADNLIGVECNHQISSIVVTSADCI